MISLQVLLQWLHNFVVSVLRPSLFYHGILFICFYRVNNLTMFSILFNMVELKNDIVVVSSSLFEQRVSCVVLLDYIKNASFNALIFEASGRIPI